MSKVYDVIQPASADAGNGVNRETDGANEEGRESAELSGPESEDKPEPELEVEPEIVTSSAPAVVSPPTGFVAGRVTRFLQRVIEGIPRPPAEPPQEVLERLDGVEVQIAALEEMVAKRLEEGEGRTLHLVEKRLEALQEEIAGVAERAAASAATQEARALKRLIVVIGAFSIGLASSALLTALGII